jgi:glycosyltransferase involved in cell wall biosynthesis
MDNNPAYLMITQYPMDGTDASTIHMAELSSHLALLGLPVKVVCPASRRSGAGAQLPPNAADAAVRCLTLPTLGLGVLRALTFQLSLAAALVSLAACRRIKCLYVRHSGLLIVPALIGVLFRLPVVLEVNGLVSEELPLVRPGRGARAMSALVGLVERVNFRLATSVVVVTPSLKEILVQEFKVNSACIHVIPNGANITRFYPRRAEEARRQLELQLEGPTVGFVGNLQPWHGVDLLVEAAPLVLSQLPQARFLVVGDGPRRRELERRTTELGIASKVVFTGAVPYSKVPLYIASFDVCAAPFPESERNSRIGGSPLKVFEYAACGRPIVISSALPIFQEIAEAGAGPTVPPNDPEALAAALVAMLRDPVGRERMGKRAREYAVARGSWARAARAVENVIAESCTAHPPRPCPRSDQAAIAPADTRGLTERRG